MSRTVQDKLTCGPRQLTGVVQGVVGGLEGRWIADTAADWQRRAGRVWRTIVARALASRLAGGLVCSSGEGAAPSGRRDMC